MDIQNIPEKVRVWRFGGKTGNLKSQNRYSTSNGGNGYNMLCQTNGKFLTYQERDAGINLGYTTNAEEHKIHLRLPDGKERDILTGEKVALGIGGGDAFLRYAERTLGINLKWTSDPVFKWRIYGATGEKGKPIPTGSWVAIVNANVEPEADFLVYLDRPVGADIGWTTSPDWKGKLTNWMTKAAFTALVKYLTA